MAAKYDVRTSSDGQYYFNLKAANGKVILTSERYTTKANALNGIRSVRTNDATPARFDRRTSVAGEPYFVLTARNGEPILPSARSRS
ncbi:YegP family protein [bacterium]|nr:YegP family protein [bacterium]